MPIQTIMPPNETPDKPETDPNERLDPDQALKRIAEIIGRQRASKFAIPEELHISSAEYPALVDPEQ